MFSLMRLVAISGTFFLLVSGAAGAASVSIRIGFLTISAGSGAAWIAKEAGFFAKNGLDAEVLYLPSTTLTQGMLAGEVPLGLAGPTSLIEANARGADFVLLGSLTKYSPISSLVTRKDITRIEQLKGKRFGVSRFGSASHRILEIALQRVKIDPRKEVSVLQIGNSAFRTVALRAGNIDATVLSVEEAYLAQKMDLNILYDLRKLNIEFLSNDFATTRKFVRESEDVARRFVKSMVEGIHFFKNNREKSIDIMTKYMRTQDREIIGVGYDWQAAEYLKKPYVPAAGLNAVWEHLAATNHKVKEMKPEQVVDSRFVRELDQSGFIDNLYR
jgi:NitT/TauT family transport system substrate-binding protein